MRRGRMAVGAVAAVLAIGGLAGCGGSDSDAADTRTTSGGDTPAASTPPVVQDPALGNSEWGSVLAAPDSYKDRDVRGLVGKVVQVEQGDGVTAVQIYTSPDLSDGNTLVYLYGDLVDTSIRDEDYVRVSGTVAGAFEGENAFGGQISAPMVNASSFKTVTATQAMGAADPPVAQKRLNVVGEQAGLRVIVRKVERLRSGGRVTVEAINGSGSPASIFSYSAKLIQGGRQSEPEYSQFPSFDGEIRPGVRQTAVLVFDEMKPGKGTLVLDWYSENWEIQAEDFELTFRIP